jgi:hypothetical protein
MFARAGVHLDTVEVDTGPSREISGSLDRGHLARIFAQGVTSLLTTATAH